MKNPNGYNLNGSEESLDPVQADADNECPWQWPQGPVTAKPRVVYAGGKLNFWLRWIVLIIFGVFIFVLTLFGDWIWSNPDVAEFMTRFQQVLRAR